jgi:predicted NBD/HSP70 family sugar kinase
MRYAIGLDIGGTKIEGCVTSEAGKIIKTVRIPTGGTKKQAIKNIFSVIDSLMTSKVSGIGVGVPGLTHKGKIIRTANAPLSNIDLASMLRRRYRMPAVIENDANCFALAEQMFGAAKGYSIVFGLITGTGVGGGIVIDGKILSGCSGGAGEIGHILADHSAKSMKTGKNDFEAICSGPNITRRYRKAGGKIKDPDPKKIFAAEKKDPVAKKTINEEYHQLGIVLASLVNTINPDCIVLGGGVSNVLSPSRIKKEIKRFSLPVPGAKVKVKRHKIGASSGVLGAAALVFMQ